MPIFLLPAKAETVSHPVIAWKSGRPSHFSMLSVLAIWWAGMFLKCLPTQMLATALNIQLVKVVDSKYNNISVNSPDLCHSLQNVPEQQLCISLFMIAWGQSILSTGAKHSPYELITVFLLHSSCRGFCRKCKQLWFVFIRLEETASSQG